jgi:hypothetical protein
LSQKLWRRGAPGDKLSVATPQAAAVRGACLAEGGGGFADNYNMNRAIILALLTAPLFVSCESVTNAPYEPDSKPEKIEYGRDVLDAYPGDVRTNLDAYANIGVAWAGIIQDTAVAPGPDGMIYATTTFDHHYFDWQENRNDHGVLLCVSPRGEGPFRVKWELTRNDPEATSDDALKYAAPGKLAIVYGVPERLDDGTVVLRYRYLRVLDPSHFTTNVYDYSRFGEPFRYIYGLPTKPQ